MTSPPGAGIDAFLHDSDRAVWSTAALVVAIGDEASPEQRAAAEAVLSAMGLEGAFTTGPEDAVRLAAQAAAPVHQVAALLRGEGRLWSAQSDEALLSQGRASARGAAAFAQLGLPMLDGLSDAFAEGARMLDVGTGVAALAVAYAELFPRLTVVGIDVMPRVLGLAAQTVAASPAGDRVIVREQDVSSLDEPDVYDLAWLPAPFLPAPALDAGVPRVVECLRSGGWLMLGHGKYGGSPLEDALNRFKTFAFGGTALDELEAQTVLGSAGLVDVVTLPTPPGSPAVTVGRKPPAP